MRFGLDVTVVNTAAPKYISGPAALDAMHALKAPMREKERRHRQPCEDAGYEYVSAVFTVYGALVGDFNDKFVQQDFKEALARAKKEGESEWEVVARHERDLDRISVVIARANACILREAPERDMLQRQLTPLSRSSTSSSSSSSPSTSSRSSPVSWEEASPAS